MKRLILALFVLAGCSVGGDHRADTDSVKVDSVKVDTSASLPTPHYSLVSVAEAQTTAVVRKSDSGHRAYHWPWILGAVVIVGIAAYLAHRHMQEPVATTPGYGSGYPDDSGANDRPPRPRDMT